MPWRKRGLSQAYTLEGKRKIIFPPLQVLMTRMRPAGTIHWLWSLQMASWQNQQKAAKGKNSYQSQHSQISICGVWSREEGKISHCLFLSEFKLAERKHRLSILSCLLVCLRTWLGSCQFGVPQTMAGQKCGLPSIYSWSPTDCFQLSGEVS